MSNTIFSSLKKIQELQYDPKFELLYIFENLIIASSRYWLFSKGSLAKPKKLKEVYNFGKSELFKIDSALDFVSICKTVIKNLGSTNIAIVIDRTELLNFLKYLDDNAKIGFTVENGFSLQCPDVGKVKFKCKYLKHIIELYDDGNINFGLTTKKTLLVTQGEFLSLITFEE